MQQNPLAWIVPHHAPQTAALMPVLFDDKNCKSLFSHLPLQAPIVETLNHSTEATCLFLGPHSYIPPEWVEDDNWIPTWNFTSIKITGKITLAKEYTRECVERLTTHMQKGSSSEWSLEQVEHRMPELLPKIIGFKVIVDKISPRFKLGQDETEENLAKIKSRLHDHNILYWIQ